MATGVKRALEAPLMSHEDLKPTITELHRVFDIFITSNGGAAHLKSHESTIEATLKKIEDLHPLDLLRTFGFDRALAKKYSDFTQIQWSFFVTSTHGNPHVKLIEQFEADMKSKHDEEKKKAFLQECKEHAKMVDFYAKEKFSLILSRFTQEEFFSGLNWTPFEKLPSKA